MNKYFWQNFITVLCFIPLLFCCTAISSSQHYIGEATTVWHQYSNKHTDSIKTDMFYIKKLTNTDTTIIDSIWFFLPDINKEPQLYVYRNVAITTFKGYNYSKTPKDTILSEVEKTLSFTRSLIENDRLSPAEAMWMDSKDYPLIKNCTVTFENGKAIVLGIDGRIEVNLDNLTATDEKGQPVIVHYPEKKR